MSANPSRVAARHVRALSNPEAGAKVIDLYLHLSNGGANIGVRDAGNGPEFYASIGSFGRMDSEVRFAVTPDGLRRMGEALLIAAEHDRFSRGTDALDPQTKDLNTFYSDELVRSMAKSLAWWAERDDFGRDEALARLAAVLASEGTAMDPKAG